MPENPRAVRTRVGRNVQRLRLLRGISQERLAELADSSSKHIGQIERGQVNVSLDVLVRIAGALSLDVSELFISGRSRASEPKHFIVTRAHLAQLEAITRTVRASRTKPARRPR